MPQVRLKRLLGKTKALTRVVNNLIDGLQEPAAILDPQDHLLLGQQVDSPAATYPIVLEAELLGRVVGGGGAATLAELVTYLVNQEVVKKLLAAEVLDRYREINLLYNLSEKLSASLALRSVLTLSLDEAHRLIRGTVGGVMLLGQEPGTLLAGQTFGDEASLQSRIRFGEGIVGAVAQTGKAELVNQVTADPRFTAGLHRLQSLVCAPLKVKQRVIGVLLIGSETPETYTAGDLKLLTTLASQAAPAIENALLYETQLKETQALEEKNLALEELDKLKDEFLANTSHELRTPLHGIIGLAETILDGATGPLNDEQRHNLSMIAISGRRLSNLVNDILDFSRLKHQDLELKIKSLDMGRIADLVLTLSKPLAEEKGLLLRNEIGPEIPPVAGDEDRFQQIMYNLIGNAIKFTPQGTVTVAAQVREDMVEVRVSDTGIGIPAAKFDDIFKSFEQVDASTAREYGGTGLGLSITKQIVELHGGEIWLESEVGKGSCFHFTVPISPQILQTLEPVEAGQTVSRVRSYGEYGEVPLVAAISPPANQGAFTIMVVDDEPVNRQVLVNHLSLQHYAVVQAANGPEALNQIEAGAQPDLILLDVMMPRMSGYEVCRQLREHHPANELPVVMLTAKNRVSNLVEGFEAGANDYLAKPFSKNELLARVVTHLQLAHINRATRRFVPGEFLEFLRKQSIVDVNLGDHVSKEMAVMFSDIRSFTTLSETMTPQENFDFVNAYLKQVSPVVRDYHGFIIKYMGDGMMAVFPNGADDAVQAGLQKLRQVAIFNDIQHRYGYPPIKIGIGIHTGHLMVGMVGEAARIQGDAFSDNVNLTSRLEGLTKFYGVPLIISAETIARLANVDRYHLRFLDRVQVKGKKEAVGIYEVFDGDSTEQIALKRDSLADFEAGQAHYFERRFGEASACFATVLARNPADQPARIYLARSQRWLAEGVAEGWTGIETMTEK